MSLVEFIILLVIASISGGIGQSLAGYSFGGCFSSILVGFIGAWLGKWIMLEFDLPVFFSITLYGKSYPVVWSIIGSAVFAFGLGIITKGRQSEN
ncbi:MAG: hypothetical protein A2068_09490 [Ignavibacteria bacterium GWB2_35_6b]|nr:MAG: hypothetical protein A2068_09490 [Ignavibacteria bacterium GWB2_35_6b]